MLSRASHAHRPRTPVQRTGSRSSRRVLHGAVLPWAGIRHHHVLVLQDHMGTRTPVVWVHFSDAAHRDGDGDGSPMIVEVVADDGLSRPYEGAHCIRRYGT